MKLKKVAALGLATAMAFSVTACSSSKPAETTAAAEEAETTAAADGEAVKEAVEGKDPAEVKVGISIYQFADNFMTLYRNELQNYLVNELGLKAENISIMDGKNDQSEQMNQIRNFVTQGFDVMIVNLVQAKNTRSRRPDHVRVIGADVCEAPNPQRTPRKGIFATQEPFLQSERTILPSEPSKLPKSPQNEIGRASCRERV